MPTYTKQNARVGRLQCDPVYAGAGGSPTAVPFQTFLAASLLTNDANANDMKGAGDWTPVNFDLMDPALASTPITAAGVTLSGYGKLAALIRQAVLDRANAAGVS